MSAKRLRITSPHGIDESGFVRISGIDQWISFRGDDRRNPVIVEIHGGPGASNLIYTHRTRAWERHFTIVRWDMRGAGKTFGRGGPDGQGEMSLRQLYRDALEVIDHVRGALGVEKVLLVANSFGSVIGLRLARQRPELFSAYVGTDQNINAGGRDHTAYDALVDRLTAAGKRKALAAITAMGPDESAWTTEQWTQYNKHTVASDPLTRKTLQTVVVGSLLFSPLHKLREARTYLQAMDFSEQVALESVTIDEWAEGTTFAIPFFVFQGEFDVITPPETARSFFDAVTAPVKDFALIRDASHFASFRHPDQFLDLLLTRVRPVLSTKVDESASIN
ncbi:alpha/beta fold hydrolase [Cryptosporangium aurantiacum]|uniref:prolyl aminopeptidase n=1 Tax=Cryptosporangium aurantiacum TaxID=134849 RepID=A0A1M7RM44_9ACTN|nr:alpha/beta hydrolase [Cryptosporangium aurantiacum]SHN47251.1 Pimeloyl-ACP methyl ester carboxylesterase [Cryptosporangium aurantiacum]